MRTPYTPSYAVARQLNLHPLVLSKLTSAFNVTSSGLRLNLGLNLKFEAKKLKVLGYSRKNDRGWEYSDKAKALLVEYMTRFPEFIARISANPTGDGWEDTTFYPDPQEAKAKMKEIGAWLKSVETKALERVPLEAEQLDADTVARMEKAADDAVANGGFPQGKRIGGVPRSALLKPTDAETRTGKQTFRLGHRVVYVLDSGRVPIAMRGTVIGMTRTTRQTLLDVVFDGTFMSGTSLNDRCSAFRGSTVPAHSVLNISERQVVAQSEAARARQKAMEAPRTKLTPGMGQGVTYGLQPGQQLTQASAPPPLRGSFRGAVAGYHNNPTPRGRGGRGGRGGANGIPNGTAPAVTRGGTLPFHPRGGVGAPNGTHAPRGGRGGPRGGAANRQGFTLIDNGDPSEGVNPNARQFQPQSYASVPPPAGLNQPAGGRGRGRGRGRADGNGRGGRGRDRGASTGAPVAAQETSS